MIMCPEQFNSASEQLEELLTEFTKTQSVIAECLEQLAKEQELLDFVLKIKITNDNRAFIKPAKKACRAGIEAWQASILAYVNDVEDLKTEIASIKKGA